MKKMFMTSILTSVLFFGTTVSASEEVEGSLDPGTTPDQGLYTFDKLLEEIQLAFTFDSEEETALLLEFAKERLAEGQVMSEEDKSEFVQQAIEDYMTILEDAQEQLSETVLNEEITDESLVELTEQIDEATDGALEMEENLEEEVQEELEETVQTIKIVAHVVKDMDEEKVTELRETGLGFGQIAQIFYLAEYAGKTVDEVATLYSEGNGFGQVTKELGIHPSQIAKLRNGKRNVQQDDDIAEESVESEGTEDTANLETTDNLVDSEQGDFNNVSMEGSIQTTVASVTSTEVSKQITQEKVKAENNKEEQKQQKKADEQKQKEVQKQAEEQKQKVAKQKAEEQKQKEEQKKAEEQKQKEEQKKAEEQKQKEEQKKAEEQKQKEEKKKAEEQKQKEEQKKAEEKKQKEKKAEEQK